MQLRYVNYLLIVMCAGVNNQVTEVLFLFFYLFFKCFFVGLATFIFLIFFMIGPELGAGIYPGMALTLTISI